MSSYDQRATARKHADLMATDLNRVSGLLEEVATVWRRAELYGQRSASMAPASLQDAARNLADAVRALPEAACEDHPALAFSAVAQLAALQDNASLSVAVTGRSHLGDAGMWTAIEGALLQARNRLWSLITCLVKVGDASQGENVAAEWDSPATWDSPPAPNRAAADCTEPGQALAMQRTAIDALPEIDLRRLLGLIGGIDPEALQRAAAAYTETFCAVTEAKASVAALQPVALAVVSDRLQDPERRA